MVLKKTLKIPAILIIAASIGCSEDAVVQDILEAPVFVAKSNDTAAFEKGIRAWPGSSLYPGRGVRLEWHTLKDIPIGGYSVYRTSTLNDKGEPAEFLKIATIVPGQNAEDTAYIDQQVTEEIRYFYKVAAFERSGSKAEGEKSAVVDFTLSSAIEGFAPANGAVLGDSAEPVFRWNVENDNTGFSVLRVFEVNAVNNAIQAPVWIFAGYPSFIDPSFRYNQDGKALLLKKGKTYGWYVTQIVPGERNHGSASRMRNFTIQ